jgi:hypothetical protein
MVINEALTLPSLYLPIYASAAWRLLLRQGSLSVNRLAFMKKTKGDYLK